MNLIVRTEKQPVGDDYIREVVTLEIESTDPNLSKIPIGSVQEGFVGITIKETTKGIEIVITQMLPISKTEG
jgi:hypothetical protein